MASRFQRLTSVMLAAALAAPLSFAVERRGAPKTDMRRLAADLNQALGRGHATVSGTPRSVSIPATNIEPPRSAAEAAYVQALVLAMNRERTTRGLRPLVLNAALDAAAADRVGDMLRQHYFNHVSPQGMEPFVWVDRRGYDYVEAGENLATGYRTPASVVDGWMHSPAHRANVLGSGFDEVGIAVADSSPARPYAGPLVVAIYAAR